MLARARTPRCPPISNGVSSALQRSARDLLGFLGSAMSLEEHAELVAAEPGARVAAAAGMPSSRAADADEQLVAGGVAEAVVDGLEVVEVDEQHRELLAASTASGREHA